MARQGICPKIRCHGMVSVRIPLNRCCKKCCKGLARGNQLLVAPVCARCVTGFSHWTFEGASHEGHLRLPSRLRETMPREDSRSKAEGRKLSTQNSELPTQHSAPRTQNCRSVPARATTPIRNKCLAPSPYC